VIVLVHPRYFISPVPAISGEHSLICHWGGEAPDGRLATPHGLFFTCITIFRKPLCKDCARGKPSKEIYCLTSNKGNYVNSDSTNMYGCVFYSLCTEYIQCVNVYIILYQNFIYSFPICKLGLV
jgi:hypothetical protein